ncbi:MAG: hypothetical protein Q4B09_11150 [Lachnospiraceae bacterium]|nr:hypothetical protein [Lachnospiraceae bacterium]
MKRMKKFLLFTLLIVCLLGVSASAKTSTNEKSVRKTISTFFSAAKKYNIPKMKKYFTKSANPKFFSNNPYMRNYLKKENRYISYKIKYVEIYGKEAKVRVAVNYPTIYDSAYSALSDMILRAILYPNSNLKKYLQNRILYYTKRNDDEQNYLEDDTYNIYLRKINGKWLISKWSVKLSDTIHSKYQSAYNDFFDEY